MANEISEHRAQAPATMSGCGGYPTQEIVRMLRIAAMQAECSMQDGNQSVDALTRSFTAIVAHLNDMDAVVQGLVAQNELAGQQRELMLQHCSNVSDKVNAAIVAFQFYDKLVQRIEHVVRNLDQLATLVADDSRLYAPAEWQVLQQLMRDGYTMAEERAVFDAMIKGEDVRAALLRLAPQAAGVVLQDDVELF